MVNNKFIYPYVSSSGIKHDFVIFNPNLLAIDLWISKKDWAHPNLFLNLLKLLCKFSLDEFGMYPKSWTHINLPCAF